jgi:DNA-binding response OmpR family regulator
MCGHRVQRRRGEAISRERRRTVPFDWVLPDGTVGLVRRLRAITDAIPIIMRPAAARESDKVTAFEVGADDYVTAARPRS